MIRFGQDGCDNLDSALRREWLESAGIVRSRSIPVDTYGLSESVPAKNWQACLSSAK